MKLNISVPRLTIFETEGIINLKKIVKLIKFLGNQNAENDLLLPIFNFCVLSDFTNNIFTFIWITYTKKYINNW